MSLKFILAGGVLPARGSPMAAGLDIACLRNITLEAGKRLTVRTGVKLAECPYGVYLRVAPRSKLANRYGIDVLAGVIDGDYRGEIHIILINHSDVTVNFESGDNIAQLIPELYEAGVQVKEVVMASVTTRGEEGIMSKDMRATSKFADISGSFGQVIT